MTRRILIAILSLLLPISISAQVQHSNHAWTIGPGNNLQPIPSASVTVCAGFTLPASGTVCSPTTTVYTDPTLTAPATNPLTADIGGNYSFWSAVGYSYVISVSGPNATTYSYSWNSGGTAGSAGLATNNAFTGNNTHSGTETFNTHAIVANAGITSAGPNALSGGGSLAGTFTGNWTPSGNITFQGNNTHGGTETFSSSIASASAGAVDLGTAALP
jgi:hypothetical protein